MKKHRLRTSLLVGMTGFLVIIMVVFILLYINLAGKQQGLDDMEKYSSYYVMITDDSESSFTRAVYEGAAAKARENDTYVELMGDNLSQKYTKEQYLDIAIASKVDGILIQADESESMTRLINTAVDAGIPVVTLFSDNTASNRCSYVGISSYNLGCEYGEQINKLLQSRDFPFETIKVMVLVNSEADNGQNLTCTAVRDTMNKEQKRLGKTKNVELSIVSVDTTNSFAVEESLRNIFITSKDEVPDIIVCLEEEETASCYQAVIDYNKVGEVSILGYFDSQTILRAIERNVIHSTITIDTAQMGAFCIQALKEYREMGNTSQYFAADLTLIDSGNVSEYLSN